MTGMRLIFAVVVSLYAGRHVYAVYDRSGGVVAMLALLAIMGAILTIRDWVRWIGKL